MYMYIGIEAVVVKCLLHLENKRQIMLNIHISTVLPMTKENGHRSSLEDFRPDQLRFHIRYNYATYFLKRT